VIVTISDFPLFVFVTRTLVPMGNVLCAAVDAVFDSLRPLAVFVPPFVRMLYHDARPCCSVGVSFFVGVATVVVAPQEANNMHDTIAMYLRIFILL
jgi:hypothetical protein